MSDVFSLTNVIGVIVGIGITAIPVIWKALLTRDKAITLMEIIAKEFKPNAGSSLKDSLNRIEAGLTKVQFLQSMAWDMSDSCIYLTDNQGKLVWANKSYLRLLGRTFDDIKISGWELSIHHEDRDIVTHEWYKACNENRPFEMRYRIIREDSTLYVRCEAHGEAGKGYIGILKIEEAKRC